ncbi:hypothetical protein [Pacificibacter marinus]|uniref:hypothetical protein n=1 Tax=Pacificibacter marinus TaxID=658057 RepID=UPI001C078870|nr:hypothetical protein [Pacificibacter marinus]MBU2868720.1 hypothetical protein [Pacificibacter marinus]
MKRLALIAAIYLAPTAPLSADEMLQSQSQVETCLATQMQNGSPVIACVNEALGACIQFTADAPQAALQCFLEAQTTWTQYISARMDLVLEKGGEDIAAIAGIEVKFDLLQNKLQCQRMTELSMLQDAPTEQTQVAAARCDATANGLVFAKLFAQSENLK